MSDVERLAAARCDKQTSNLQTKPIDLLRAAAHDLEAGLVKCDSVLILFLIAQNQPTRLGHSQRIVLDARETERSSCSRCS